MTLQGDLLESSVVDRRQQDTWPKKIIFYAVALSWELHYQWASESTTTELNEEDNRLIISGSTKDFRECGELLHPWLQKQAERYFTPWLQKLSHDYQLPYEKLSYRGQKTLWGSCTEGKNISLNYKLLFLPARLVRYVLIHELCHTKILDHSRQFWNLVANF